MQVRKYYLKLKTCTLALCRPDKTRQRRIWHKQSALCWSVPLTLTLSPEGRGDGTVLLQAGKTLAMKLPVIP